MKSSALNKRWLSGEEYILLRQMEEVIDCARVVLNDLLPSVWAEQNRILADGVSAVEGFFSFRNSPYVREMLDCLAPDNPVRTLVIMKAAQIGLSTSFVENAIGWIISQSPGNILYLIGHEDNMKDTTDKLDKMIDGAGLRHMIRSSVKRARNVKSGDTDTRKDFPGGYLRIGTAKHKALANFSVKYGFIDDYERMKSKSVEAGTTKGLVRKRFSAFSKQYKLCFLSSPELKDGSNIEEAYLDGDQRKYHIPCPCCGEFITLEWETKCEKEGIEHAGITWQLDESGVLIDDSVGYTCQKCGGFFDDRNKMELLNAGKWIPTAKPKDPDCRSYHISALYAPVFMDTWLIYVRQWIEINPVGGKRNESKYQDFKNLVLGETYEPVAQTLDVNALQRNQRSYQVGIIPEKQSIADGNGMIVLVTIAADCNGTEDDARIDYEVVAWSETGASYSVDHGSVGTFIPKALDPKGKIDRKKWTYNKGATNSVWPAFEAIKNKRWETDSGRRIQALIGGIDSSYLTTLVYGYVDNSNGWTIALKGKDQDKDHRVDVDKKTFKISQERGNLWLVESNIVKDQLMHHMGLKWNQQYHEAQPAWFMNFPAASDGKYEFNSYFSHFDSEKRIKDVDEKNFKWVKKSPTAQNHLWDCRCYNIVVKDIFLHQWLKDQKIPNGTWSDYAGWIAGIAKKRTQTK